MNVAAALMIAPPAPEGGAPASASGAVGVAPAMGGQATSGQATSGHATGGHATGTDNPVAALIAALLGQTPGSGSPAASTAESSPADSTASSVASTAAAVELLATDASGGESTAMPGEAKGSATTDKTALDAGGAALMTATLLAAAAATTVASSATAAGGSSTTTTGGPSTTTMAPTANATTTPTAAPTGTAAASALLGIAAGVGAGLVHPAAPESPGATVSAAELSATATSPSVPTDAKGTVAPGALPAVGGLLVGGDAVATRQAAAQHATGQPATGQPVADPLMAAPLPANGQPSTEVTRAATSTRTPLDVPPLPATGGPVPLLHHAVIATASTAPSAASAMAPTDAVAHHVVVPDLDPNVARVGGLIRSMHGGEVRSATLTLRPAELGEVRVELHTDGGNLAVHLTASHEHGADALRAATPALRRELESAGLGLDRVDVGVGGGAAEQRQGTHAHELDDADGPALSSNHRPVVGVGLRRPNAAAPTIATDGIDLDL